MSNLEYQFEIEIFKRNKIVIKTERMPYETACDLSNELGKKGIHYKIKEIDLRCNNRRQITNKMLHSSIYRSKKVLEEV